MAELYPTVDVYAKDEENTAGLYFAQSPEIYWSLTRAVDSDVPYLLEKDNEGSHCSSGIISVDLNRTQIEFKLDDKAAAQINSSADVAIRFDVADAVYDEIIIALRSIFRDEPLILRIHSIIANSI